MAVKPRSCPSCGGLVGSGDAFCRQCGEKLEKPARPRRRPLPYEAADPRAGDEGEARVRAKWFAENRTGRKATAVIDEPRGCMSCVFHAMRWSGPHWARPSAIWGYMNEPGTQGLACSLAKNGVVCVTEWQDRGYKPEWCPLEPVEAPC